MNLTVYYSHPIRGKQGDDAPQIVVDTNCAISLRIANTIRSLYPQLDVYVSAEHEEFVMASFSIYALTITQVLDIDCAILAKKDLVIVLDIDGDIYGGREVEINYAIDKRIPVFFLAAKEVNGKVEVSDHTLRRLGALIEVLEKEKTKGK